MTSILDRIAKHKKEEVHLAKQSRPLNQLMNSEQLPLRNFLEPLKKNSPAIIAEIKKASPSKGILCSDFDVAKIAKIYEDNGASCISVLTDIDFFQGHPSYLAQAKLSCALPVLRKDFIVDLYQVYESRALGADCILLIVAILDDSQLLDYCQLAQEMNMSVLVESHTAAEFERALRLPTPLMGVNNRSLHSFETNIQTSLDLNKSLPSDKILISESGINSSAEIQLMQQQGINTFLIGESLVRAPNIGLKLQELLNKIVNKSED